MSLENPLNRILQRLGGEDVSSAKESFFRTVPVNVRVRALTDIRPQRIWGSDNKIIIAKKKDGVTFIICRPFFIFPSLFVFIVTVFVTVSQR